ncbi:MAG: response regulator [bacterium]
MSGKVLLVDDNLTILKLGEMILKRSGYEVDRAEDGVEAVEIFAVKGAEYVAVILDLTMPRMSGSEAFEKIREIDPKMKVILSSGYDEMDAVSQLQGEGVGFIQKPYRPQELTSKLEEVLNS